MGKKLTFRIFLILSIPVFIYFWGVAIVGNIANFWNFFTPADFKEIVWEDSPVTPPSFSGLPKAVKESKFSVRGFAQEGVEVFIYLNGIEAARVRADKNGIFSPKRLTVIRSKASLLPGRRSSTLSKRRFWKLLILAGNETRSIKKLAPLTLSAKLPRDLWSPSTPPKSFPTAMAILATSTHSLTGRIR